MVSVLPSRIMNYNVSSASPTDELITIWQILSEVGDYASTVLDREHLSLSRKCGTRLRKVVGELKARDSLFSDEGLYDICPDKSGLSDKSELATLTIEELHSLYRCWPIRHKERAAKGCEHLTFYYEGRIVRELLHRKAANKREQFKIDYCVATYNYELENLSFIFSRSVKLDEDKIFPDSGRIYTADELVALIRLYSDYRDVTEREILIEYVDFALDLLESDKDTSPLSLLTVIAELGRRKTIRVPEWVIKRLYCTIKDLESSKDCALAEAMLTLDMVNCDMSFEHKAQRIINRCYKAAFVDDVNIDEQIEYLHTAVTCCDYVTRFSVRKTATLWDKVSSRILSSDMVLTSKKIFQLLEIAKELENCAPVEAKSKEALKQMLEELAKSDSPESKAYNRIAELKF